jgi:hypothetical protein
MINIPQIGNLTAKELCGLFQEPELLDSIAYLELVINKQLSPGAELFRLGIELNYSTQELWAVQNRLALAIHHIRKANHNKSLMIPIKQSCTKSA